jgi:hypothetical protein
VCKAARARHREWRADNAGMRSPLYARLAATAGCSFLVALAPAIAVGFDIDVVAVMGDAIDEGDDAGGVGETVVQSLKARLVEMTMGGVS